MGDIFFAETADGSRFVMQQTDIAENGKQGELTVGRRGGADRVEWLRNAQS